MSSSVYNGMGPCLELLAQGIIAKIVEGWDSKMIAYSEGCKYSCKTVGFYFL